MEKSEMIKSCAWLGLFVRSHEIGEYFIVEYKPKQYKDCAPISPAKYGEESEFHPFVRGRNTNTSYGSLDAAIVGAIAIKHEGANTQADRYFMKAISQ